MISCGHSISVDLHLAATTVHHGHLMVHDSMVNVNGDGRIADCRSLKVFDRSLMCRARHLHVEIFAPEDPDARQTKDPLEHVTSDGRQTKELLTSVSEARQTKDTHTQERRNIIPTSDRRRFRVNAVRPSISWPSAICTWHDAR
jgi:hypothetical protein